MKQSRKYLPFILSTSMFQTKPVYYLFLSWSPFVLWVWRPQVLLFHHLASELWFGHPGNGIWPWGGTNSKTLEIFIENSSHAILPNPSNVAFPFNWYYN